MVVGGYGRRKEGVGVPSEIKAWGVPSEIKAAGAAGKMKAWGVGKVRCAIWDD